MIGHPHHSSRSDDTMVAVGFNPRLTRRLSCLPSRSDDMMVAVGFNPRFVMSYLPVRRVATIEHCSHTPAIIRRRYVTRRRLGRHGVRGLKPTATVNGRYATQAPAVELPVKDKERR